ncbi:hypothetical protein PM082_019968 [Marasmius tenuissimus]|nr:hypothetical protein PM082_019968 [Marasmius tenuissimus]
MRITISIGNISLRTANMDSTYGHSMYSQFMLDSDFVNLNHGSFGCLPRAVYDAHNKITEEVEQNPDLFVRKKLAGAPAVLDESWRRSSMRRRTNAYSFQM